MREALFLTIALLSAEETPGATPVAPISVKYSTICADYNQAMANARAKNAPQEELRRIGGIRHDGFRALIADGLNEPEKMMAADWAAIAMASEYLFQRDECIKYSFRAVELDPRTKEAYAPLIRSLLNANRIDDAETALASAEKHLDGTRWHGMHHILFIKYRKQKHWIQAASHLQTALEIMLSNGGESAAGTRMASKHLSEYLVTTQQADLEEHGRRQLHTWLRVCADAVDQKSSDDAVGVHELHHCAALCEVQCEIAKCSPELVYDDYLLLWAKAAYNPRWAWYQKACRSQQMYFGKYVVSNATSVKSWNKVAAGFSQLLKDHFAVENEKGSEVSKAILIKLQAFANSRVATVPASEIDVKP